jgi:hypothetical protein
MFSWAAVKKRWRKVRGYVIAHRHALIGTVALLQVALVAVVGCFYYSSGNNAVVFTTRLEVRAIPISQAAIANPPAVFGFDRTKRSSDRAWKQW